MVAKEKQKKIIPYCMIDIIYKTLKPSHFTKKQIIQNIKNLMFQVIFIFSDWILIKQIIVSSTPFCCWGKQIFERGMREWGTGLGEWVISRCLNHDDKNLGTSFDWEGTCDKMHRIIAFSKIVNSKKFGIFPTWWNIKVWEKM